MNRLAFAVAFSTLTACLLMLDCARSSHKEAALGENDHSIPLLRDIGSLHHPINTRSPEAQKFFDQGLTLAYGFNFPGAIESFRRASELDPNSPMPYWGLAFALAPNYNSWRLSPGSEHRAWNAILAAKRLYTRSTDEERAYIEALAQEFDEGAFPDLQQRERNYAAAMQKLSRRYPDDPDAAVLYAAALMQLQPWHLWTVEGNPAPDTPEIRSILENVLRRWPDHVGANHFYIHAMEGSPFPERALASAHRLETLVPIGGHLLHMPSHVYFRTGDYAGAIASNLKAIAADKKYSTETSASGSEYSGYSYHNLNFLSFSASMAGDFQTAYNAANELQTSPHSQAFMVAPMLVLLRFARWDDLLALPPPDDSMLGFRLFWHYARGCAFARKGNLQRAGEELGALEDVYKEIPPGRAFGMFFNDWNTLREIAVDALNARIAAARRDDAAAIRCWRAGVAVEDKMNFDDLPDWYYPLRESLGAALLRCGQLSDAEQVFREDLARTPRNPRSLFGLWKTLEAENKTADAVWVKREFDASWKGAVSDLRIENF